MKKKGSTPSRLEDDPFRHFGRNVMSTYKQLILGAKHEWERNRQFSEDRYPYYFSDGESVEFFLFLFSLIEKKINNSFKR